MKTEEIKILEDMKICIVDDDEFVVGLVKKVLSSSGFKNLQTFTSAENCLSKAFHSTEKNNLPSIVIADLVLPKMNGFELCIKIKKLYPDIPVVLISGYDIEDIHKKLIDCEADDFLPKPFSPIELLTRIKIHLTKVINTPSNDKDKDTSTEIVINSKEGMPYIGDKIGEYVIVDTVGWGKSSIIFKVTVPRERKTFALKIITRQASEFKDIMLRFQSETSVMEKLKHPNITKFINKGCHSGLPFIVMEFIEGLDLEEYLITKGKIPFTTCFRIAYGIGDAIKEIHNNGFVHRDIKLKNILFDLKSKYAKIIDFGLTTKSGTKQHLTRDGFVVGTPIYMAPEVFEGDEATVKSDIYSYGATFYHLITGSPPFVADSSRELYRKHLSQAPAPIRSHRPEFPLKCEKIIIECMAKDPKDRPESMENILKVMKEFLTI